MLSLEVYMMAIVVRVTYCLGRDPIQIAILFLLRSCYLGQGSILHQVGRRIWHFDL